MFISSCISLTKTHEVILTSVSPILQVKSIKPGFIKQKGEDLFKDINPESNGKHLKDISSKCFESVLARVTVLINTHTILNALQLYAHSCKMTTAKGSTGQTHILDKSSLYRRSRDKCCQEVHYSPPLPQKSPPNSFIQDLKKYQDF